MAKLVADQAQALAEYGLVGVQRIREHAHMFRFGGAFTGFHRDFLDLGDAELPPAGLAHVRAGRNQRVQQQLDVAAVEDVVVTDRDEEFMKNVMAWLGENIENSELTIDQLASHLGLGRTTMYNKLKSLTGKSPVELIKEYRITKSKLLLRTGQFSVSEVAYKVGFSDPGYFSRCFREQYHMSPAEYLKTHNLKQEDTKTA